MIARPHTLVAFDTDLFALRAGVLAMAELACRQFDLAIRALETGNTEFAVEVLVGERAMNALQVSLDAACGRVIARHQPTATDLREVVGALHSIGDLERIGDESKKIARKAAPLRGSDAELLRGIVTMAASVSSMLQRATDAFRDRDASVAAALSDADEAIDRERDRLVDELAARIASEAGPLPNHRAARLLDLVLAVQSIERVGDHAEGFAKYVVQVVEGVDARHRIRPDDRAADAREGAQARGD